MMSVGARGVSMGTGNDECKLRADVLCQDLQQVSIYISRTEAVNCKVQQSPEVTGLEYSPSRSGLQSF